MPSMPANADVNERASMLMRQICENRSLEASGAAEFRELFMELWQNGPTACQSPLILPYAKTVLHIDLPR